MSGYADFSYYRDEFLGREIAEEDFPRLIRRASEQVDAATRNRARDASGGNLRAVKDASCAIAEILQQAENGNPAAVSANGSAPVASEQVGSYRVSYQSAFASVADWEASTNSRIQSAITKYLAWTGLLYAGVPVI